MNSAFALHKVVLDAKNEPIDYIFLEVNDAFEKMIGLQREKILGMKVTEVIPGIKLDPANWVGRYGKVALTGEHISFIEQSVDLKRWYSVSAYRP